MKVTKAQLQLQVTFLKREIREWRKTAAKLERDLIDRQASADETVLSSIAAKTAAEQRASDLKFRLDRAEKRIEQLLAVLVKVSGAR